MCTRAHVIPGFRRITCAPARVIPGCLGRYEWCEIEIELPAAAAVWEKGPRLRQDGSGGEFFAGCDPTVLPP